MPPEGKVSWDSTIYRGSQWQTIVAGQAHSTFPPEPCFPPPPLLLDGQKAQLEKGEKTARGEREGTQLPSSSAWISSLMIIAVRESRATVYLDWTFFYTRDFTITCCLLVVRSIDGQLPRVALVSGI